MNYPEFAPDLIQASGYDAFIIHGKPAIQSMLLGLMASGIAEFEGFHVPETDKRYPTIAQRHNNPGNLRPIGASTGFRTFATPLDGYKALVRQIVININRGLTLREFFLGKPGVYPGYTPLGPGTGNTAEVLDNYIAFVANRMNIKDSVILARYFPDISNYDDFSPLPYALVWTYKPFYAKK